MSQTSTEVRVRYSECDPMGVAHHSVYAVWLEQARTEALRAAGIPYRDLESRGVYFVVVEMSLRYRRPARYDDVLDVVVTGAAPSRARLEHDYRILRGDELIATARTTLACVGTTGRVQPVPDDVWACLSAQRDAGAP